MKTVLVLFALAGCLLLTQAENLNTKKRTAIDEENEVDVDRRSIFNFGSMIRKVTGKNALKFNGHGNWCGKGGSGRIRDPLDRCCYIHDKCYDSLIASSSCKSRGWKKYHLYWRSYSWSMVWGRPYCRDSSRTRPCRRRLCYCDRAAALCFKKYKHLLRG